MHEQDITRRQPGHHLSQMGQKPGYISVYRRKLIDDQIIMPASYGYVQFMLPFFDRFVEEQIMFDEF
ncbi:hypothetical protein [Companilactobacillus alimentarius]|uniref:hypothetical protein n=1 Tax=Companilactobacillus alimentarius TaxID=1602 RepID=UPI0028B646FE|nr:hypothetical protein [Companilactobacillus alimentarius]MDT6953629.1 hypothetical protein [Companilactobacillus alimentarius]